MWSPRAGNCLGVAAVAVAAAALPAASEVLCGGHFAVSCAACPAGHGEAWCNGDCAWLSRGCIERSSPESLLDSLMEYLVNKSMAGIWGGTSWVVSGCIMLCFAVAYKRLVVDQMPQERIRERGEESHPSKPRLHGLFDCFFHVSTCLYTMCCTPLVAAKNYEVGRVCPFWPACLLMFVGMYSPLYCVTAGVRALWSGRLKRNLGYEPNFCMDCLLSLFCWHCEVGRESLEVDEEDGVEIVCINRIRHVGLMPPVYCY